MDKSGYVLALQEKLREILADVTEKRARIQALTSEVEASQKQAEHIVELLKDEKVAIDLGELSSIGSLGLSELAFQELNEWSPRKPRHYKELSERLAEKGVAIPGKDPAANLLAHIARDARFLRVGSGTYGLREWGLKAATNKRRKSRRGRKAGA